MEHEEGNGKRRWVGCEERAVLMTAEINGVTKQTERMNMALPIFCSVTVIYIRNRKEENKS